MAKRADSVRSLGTASIGTDKPTRDKFKAAARANGYDTLSGYMRDLASSIAPGQGGIPGMPVPDTSLESRINAYMDARFTGVLAPGGAWYEAIKRIFDERDRQMRLKLEGDMA